MSKVKMNHPVDVLVGMKVRQRRRILGMTQTQLAEKVGVKFQQIQKYETGANRISASKLWEISQHIDVPIADFFEGANDNSEPSDVAKLADDLNSKELASLMKMYRKIPVEERKKLVEMAQILAK